MLPRRGAAVAGARAQRYQRNNERTGRTFQQRGKIVLAPSSLLFDAPNAHDICNRSFNLYLNERYGEQEARDAVKAIVKVEKHFGKT